MIIDVIKKHPAVQNAYISKEVYKNKECIIARYASSCNIQKKELFETCVDHLSGFMVPSVFIRTDIIKEKRLV